MKLRILALAAEGARNLATLRFEPRERFSVFVGNNGQGKTNLLEAIFVVATLRSFRTSKLSDLIAFGRPDAKLGARVTKDDLTRVYEVELAPGSRKVRLDGKAPRPLARYFGAFNVVVFTPDDLGLPRGAPGDRRRFLDRSVFNLEPGYLAVASDHDKVLRSRNAVLRQVGQGTLSGRRADELLDVYDEQLAGLATQIAGARGRFLDRIAPELERAFAAITRTGLGVRSRLASKVAGLDAAAVRELLRESRARDLATQATQTGPHRDDLVFELDGREAGSFASQGQLRAIMLAWKTAELSLLGVVHGDLPVLLLDDVSSELDPSRNEYLFEHLAALAGQCFITTTHASHVLVHRERADYRLETGRILS
ncbi:MAG: DNA replication/repair protein RecF [Deltaproteobacteria bacterium]|nr:DNA replication/repair protein RecF [Deltaproteobacteria bacterium]